MHLREAIEVSTHGGKAVQLGTAMRAGLPVPDGYALSVQEVDGIARGDTNVLALLSVHSPVAVRSSAVGEDSVRASFAGQHATCLNVEPQIEAIAHAVREVWQSASSHTALAYRRRLGIAGTPQIAAVVQTMIDSTIAGVLFTRDPTNGDDVRVIEAAPGLGTNVVDGLVTPDRFRIARDGAILERTLGDDDRLCLNDDQLMALVALAARCEAIFGNDRDLEWAFKNDSLYLLQCRPITAMK